MLARLHASTLRLPRLASCACLLLACIGVAPSRAEAPAELVLLHGRILTVDPGDSTAQALAVRDGKIVAVGTDQEILRMAGAATRRIDLQGRTATPGLIDSHAHIADGGVEDLYHVRLSDARNVAEVVSRVRAGIAHLKPGEWLQGDGWDEGKLAERRYVMAADLDAASPNNPVWLMHTTGHYGVANSQALRLANIAASTEDPPAGTIDRDARGAPTGVLKEAAKDAVVKLIPPPTPEQQRAGILHSIELLHREGMTAVKDPDDRAAGVGRLPRAAARRQADGARLRALACGQHAGLGSRGAPGDPGATAAAEILGGRPAALLRRQDIHGRQRRRAHGLGVPGLEQEFHGHRYRQQRLSVGRSRSLSPAGASLSSGRRACGHSRGRRSRHRLGGRHLRAGARRHADRGT